ncbi:glycoside hydrolase family 26 protein [Nostoc sp.]|uniref:glycoside hydrolase family 26 protein n=1 Tax=Nostoc sp. TaxID=1180 RepID=UPI002FF7474E
MNKVRLALMMLILLGSILVSKNLMAVADASRQLENRKGNQIRNQTAFGIPVLLGLYTPDYIGNQSTIDSQLRQVDQWTGKRHSIAGFFFDIEDSNPAYNIPVSLEQLKHNGYTAFINLKSTRSAAQIARGDIDSSLQKVAKAYAKWANQGEGRIAFIAPLQEMNIPGEAYSKDPQNFKLAYQRIQKIFKETGVSSQAIRWVFAPNGWSENNEHRFENYYPGDKWVDIVAFSSYNWGYCSNSSWKHWNSPKEVFEPYIKRMKVMAGSKPIFIAQTASTSNTQNGLQRSTKDQWLRDSYTQLPGMGVRAILYFNINKECDWAINSNSGKSAGYKDAVNNPDFGYLSPAELAKKI